MSPAIATLALPPDGPLSRGLHLSLGLLTGHLCVVMSVDHKVIQSVTGTDAELEPSLAFPDEWHLRLAGARFRLTPDELAQVRATFEPHGLKIDSAFPLPAQPIPVAAHEVAPARVESPPSICTDGGASEDQHERCAAVRLLIDRESL